MRATVIDNARELGLDVNVRRLPGATASPAVAAAAVGCGQSRIAICAVYVGDGDPVVCISSAECDVDVDLLADVLDVAEIRLATAGEIRAATGFPPEGVPPFGHGLPVVFDEALMGQPTVWAPAGDGYTVVEIDPQRLTDCTAATVATVTVPVPA
jgi:prolyl-tRNA editing enzyme YbaK/EbsC (Cys-tRNA(Pro) deacylase)